MHLGNFGSLESFRAECRRIHLKITPQREVIFEELMRLKNKHPSAEDVYRRVEKKNPHISFDTVNRTLLKFVEIGIIDVLKGTVGPRRFDPVRKNHHHFFCMKCGTIIDFTNKKYDEMEIPEEIQQKFSIRNKRVVLSGLCEKCNRIKKGKAQSIHIKKGEDE